MKRIFIALFLLSSSVAAVAQTKSHRLVYDLNSSDTAVQGTVLRQFNNVLTADPNAQLELVCHGQAIYMFVNGKSAFEERANALKKKGKVAFKVCNNSMKRYNVDKSEIITSLADIVPVAVLELSDRQMDGWSYVKAGN